MSEATHTPGSWKCWAGETGEFNITVDDGVTICSRSAWGHRANESRANAHLIAAAPELLAALRAVVAVADRKTDEFDRARAAIAKAEGSS